MAPFFLLLSLLPLSSACGVGLSPCDIFGDISDAPVGCWCSQVDLSFSTGGILMTILTNGLCMMDISRLGLSSPPPSECRPGEIKIDQQCMGHEALANELNIFSISGIKYKTGECIPVESIQVSDDPSLSSPAWGRWKIGRWYLSEGPIRVDYGCPSKYRNIGSRGVCTKWPISPVMRTGAVASQVLALTSFGEYVVLGDCLRLPPDDWAFHYCPVEPNWGYEGCPHRSGSGWARAWNFPGCVSTDFFPANSSCGPHAVEVVGNVTECFGYQKGHIVSGGMESWRYWNGGCGGCGEVVPQERFLRLPRAKVQLIQCYSATAQVIGGVCIERERVEVGEEGGEGGKGLQRDERCPLLHRWREGGCVNSVVVSAMEGKDGKEAKKEIKVKEGKPKMESLRNVTTVCPIDQISRIERRVKDRIKIKLTDGEEVGKYKVIDVIEPDAGINDIYVVRHKETEDVHCLKVESRDERFPILKTELFILLEIRKKADSHHFCKVYDRGQEKLFNFMVTTLAGPSLKNLRRDLPARKLSLGCGLSVGKQCLKALEELHRINFIHRDVSPSNFACGRREFEEERKIYFLDFGFCHQYRDKSGVLKRPRPKPTQYMGGLRHAPRAAYLKVELSRGDDLEGWFYMFVELLKGGLPWMNLKDPGEVYRYQRKCRVGLEKEEMLGGLPVELEKMMHAIDRLSYYDEPDYGMLYQLIDQVMARTKVEEFPYDWEAKAEGGEEKK